MNPDFLLWAGEFCRIQVFCNGPQPVKFLHVEAGDLRAVDDDHIFIVVFGGITGKIERTH